MPTVTMKESVRFVCTPSDKLTLDMLAEHDAGRHGGKASLSTTLRRLIHQEARQRGLVVKVTATEVEEAGEPV